MTTIENLISTLKKQHHLLRNGKLCHDEVVAIGKSPLLHEHELAKALWTLNATMANMQPPSLAFDQTAQGAIPLFKRGAFSWGGLPYPKEHAELAWTLHELGRASGEMRYVEMARKCAEWQQNICDHKGHPLVSLFLQEKGSTLSELTKAYTALFKAIPQQQQPGIFADPEHGLMCKKSEQSTILSAGTGCKSGMGIFLHREVGVANFGPTLLPLAECKAFGLAGRAKKQTQQITEKGFVHSYQNSLSAIHQRETGFAHLGESGNSFLWIDAESICDSNSLIVKCLLQGCRPLQETLFLFFGKGESCVVGGSQKLRPRTLDKYLGPPAPIELRGEGVVHLEGVQGLSKLEVIPLAGGEDFWGADFLVAYSLGQDAFEFKLACN